MKSEKWSKCEFRKNFFAIILHTYIDTPCIALYINTLQRFQISFKPTLNLHSTYTNNYVSSTISTTCTTSKYFSPSKHIIFHHLHQAFMKDTENIISTYTLSSFMIHFKLYIIHYKLLFFRIKMQKVCRFSVGLV